MKHLSSIVLTAAVLAAGTVACFKDPTSSLRNGASRIIMTRSTVFLNVGGDSLQVQAEVKDDQGNTFDVSDATWTSSNTAVAVVNPTTSQYIPYNALSRAFIHTPAGGMAWVYFESHGLKDSVQVYGLPATFDGAITAPAGLMLGDTISIAATSILTFTDSTTVSIGGAEAVILTRSPTLLQVTASQPAAAGSEVVLSHLLLSGAVDRTLPATTAIGVASTIRGGSAAVAPATGTVGDTITITANGIVTFSVAAGAESGVTVGGTPAWVLSQTATEIKAITPLAAAGSAVSVSHALLYGSVQLASLDAAPTVTFNAEAGEPGNGDPTTPSTATLYTDYYGSLSGTDGEDYVQFTTTTADSVRVEVEWLTDADVDGYLIPAADPADYCTLDGCSGGTSANPEHMIARLAAATSYIVDVYLYDAGSVTPILYRIRTTKLQ